MEENKLMGPRSKILSQEIVRCIDKRLAAHDLTNIQSFFLKYLNDHEDEAVFAKDLEKRFHISHPTVSGILQRMEAKDFIAFDENKADRRCKRILMTEKARQLQQRIPSEIMAVEEAMFLDFSEEEKDTLLALLDRVIDNLKNYETMEDTAK